MDNLLNYQPVQTSPQEARLLAPAISEHQPLQVKEPLVNLVGSLASWAEDIRKPELEKAKLDIAANNGVRTPEQETNWLLSNADLNNLEISASAQTWATQHLIDQKQFEHLPPEVYSKHLAEEAKTLTENSANPEWMAARLNHERAQLEETHSRAHAEYAVVKGVGAIDNLMGVQIAQTQELVKKAATPEQKQAVLKKTEDFFTTLLNDPEKGHFAWLAFQKRRNMQLEQGSPEYYNLQEMLVKNGRLHKGSLDADPGLEAAKQKYSEAMSQKIIQGTALLAHQQDTHQDTTKQEAYLKNLYAIAATSALPLNDEAKNILEAYAQEVENHPKLVAARDAQAKAEYVAGLGTRLAASKAALKTAREEGDEKLTAVLLREHDQLTEEIAQAGNLSPEEKQGLHVHAESALNSGLDAGEAKAAKTKAEPIYDAMRTSGDVDDIMNLAQQAKRVYSQSQIANPALRKAVQEEARHTVAGILLAKMKEMHKALPDIEATEGPGGVRRHLAEMKKLLGDNNALPIAAGAEWTAAAHKVLNSYTKNGLPTLATELAQVISEFKSKYANPSGEFDLTGIPGPSKALAIKHMEDFKEVSTETGVPTNLLLAVANKESGFREGLLHGSDGDGSPPSNATGPMQVIPKWHTKAGESGHATELDLKRLQTDYKYGIARGAEYLRYLLDKHNGNTELALREYKGGPKGMNDAKSVAYARSVLAHIPKQLPALNVASDASLQSEIADSWHNATTPEAIQQHQQNLKENEPLLMQLTGAPAGSTEDAHYRALVPADQQKNWNSKAPSAYAEAKRLGAPLDKLNEANLLIWKTPGVKSKLTGKNPWENNEMTRRAIEGWMEDTSKPLPATLLTRSTEVVQSKMKEMLLPKQREMVTPLWEGGNPEAAVAKVKAMGGGPIVADIAENYILETDQGPAGDEKAKAIKAMYTDTESDSVLKPVVDTTGDYNAQQTRKARALIKAVSGQKLPYKGETNQAMLDEKYTVPTGKEQNAKNYFFTQESVKQTREENKPFYLKLFIEAGMYASSPLQQLALATDALAQTQYQTNSGIRMSNNRAFTAALKAADPEHVGKSDLDTVLLHPVVQGFLLGRGGFLTNHEQEQQKYLLTGRIWHYDEASQELRGIDIEATEDPVVIPKYVWAKTLFNYQSSFSSPQTEAVMKQFLPFGK